jgi:hypothetical protein
MSGQRFFLQALGAPLELGGRADGVVSAERDSPATVSASRLPESWRGTALVVLLSLLVLQAARWSIYLQPQYYFIKPAVLLVCWAGFLAAWRWRLGRRVGSVDAGGAAWVADWVVGGAAAAVLMAGPVVEWINRRFQVGDPPEFLAFDLVLATAMLLSVADSRRWRQAALVSSAFAALMVTFAKPDPAVYGLAILFGVVGLWRMMTTYWEGIESKAVGSTRGQVPFRFSILGLTTVFVLLLALVATALSRPALGWSSRWSFFSGGEQWSDPFATSGVGDGENLVAATKSAQSEGPIDSDMFIESKQRSLYDVVTQMYGDQKPTPRQETSQAVGVQSENYLHNHGRLAKVEKNTSSFQTSRTTQGKPRPKPTDALSDALLLVTGSAPTHLALETYDLFDGETWFQSADNPRRAMRGVLPGEDNEWFCFSRGDGMGLFQGLKTYQVAILHLKSDRIPLPPLTEAWSIGHVKQPRFYRPTPDDGLQMTLGNTIPELTLVRLVARGFRLQGLPNRDFWRQARLPRLTTHDEDGNPLPEAQPELELPVDEPVVQSLNRLADQWAGKAGPGWAKVEAIVAGLRQHYRHEPMADPSLAKFLEQKSGPDYLFATAAVLMLRTQGVPTRLVSGFYLDPQRFDPRTGKTAVLAQDAHFWAEVHVGDGNWIPIEPTPGYLATPESLTLLDQCVQGLMAGLTWVGRRWPWALLTGVVAALLFGFRRGLAELAGGWAWRGRLWLRPQTATTATLAYLERLAVRRGVPRAAHQPVGAWLTEAFAAAPGAAESLNHFRELWQRRCYDPQERESPEQWAAHRVVCRQLVRDLVATRPPSPAPR